MQSNKKGYTWICSLVYPSIKLRLALEQFEVLRFRLLFPRLFQRELNPGLIFTHIRNHRVTLLNVQAQDLFSKRIFQVFLDGPVQRTCTKLNIISFLRDKVLGFFSELECKAERTESLRHSIHQDVDDLVYIFFGQRIEDDNIINTVKELRRERSLQCLLNYGLVIFFAVLGSRLRSKSYSFTKIFQLAYTDI